MARPRGFGIGTVSSLIAGLLLSGATSGCFAVRAGFTKASLFAQAGKGIPGLSSTATGFCRRAFASSVASASALSCSCCRDCRSSAPPARPRHLRLVCPPRPREFGCQRLGPVVLLLQRLPQLRRLALGRLLKLRRLVAPLARQRHLRLDGLPRLR